MTAPAMAPGSSLWQRALDNRRAAVITHGCLLVMTVAMFALLWWTPLYIAVIPGALLHHRIGILVHEYIHGIPFRRYRNNLVVTTFYDGLLLSFGFVELFRATHLAHHKWLNTERDPAHQTSIPTGGPRSPVLRALWALEAPQHVGYMRDALTGKVPIVRPRLLVAGFAQSIAWTALWLALGRADVVLGLVVLAAVTTLLSSSLRGAIEHHDAPGTERATNEYRTVLPLFNMNRHAHHHASPTTPWYRLEFQTASPLPRRAFVTHWVRVYVTRRFKMLGPETALPPSPGT
jgi:fatty acid desaturase